MAVNNFDPTEHTHLSMILIIPSSDNNMIYMSLNWFTNGGNRWNSAKLQSQNIHTYKTVK